MSPKPPNPETPDMRCANGSGRHSLCSSRLSAQAAPPSAVAELGVVEKKKTMICVATIEDADDLAALYLESRSRDIPYAPLVHSEAEIRDWMRSVLIPQGQVFVFMIRGRIAAMIALSETRR